jgi:hypothetical protein
MIAHNGFLSSKAMVLVCGAFGVALALGCGTQVRATTAGSVAPSTSAESLALAPDSKDDIQPGTTYCINNGDVLCETPMLYTSPWSFTPAGFREEYYSSIDNGTGPSASQQAQLEQAMADYNSYLESSGTAACLHNSSPYCD